MGGYRLLDHLVDLRRNGAHAEPRQTAVALSAARTAVVGGLLTVAAGELPGPRFQRRTINDIIEARHAIIVRRRYRHRLAMFGLEIEMQRDAMRHEVRLQIECPADLPHRHAARGARHDVDDLEKEMVCLRPVLASACHDDYPAMAA